MNYELSLRVALTVEADSEDEAKQYLVDALGGWNLDKNDIAAEVIYEEDD